LGVINGSIIISNRKKGELLQDLKKKGFKTFVPPKKVNNDESEEPADVEGEDDNEDELVKGFDYLLSMKIWSLTMEKVENLSNERNAKK
jgi:DNA topoisomerase-2